MAHGVRTRDDMMRFSQMICGDHAIFDYKDRMPEDRSDCWLFVSRGACATGALLAGLADCVPGMIEDLT